MRIHILLHSTTGNTKVVTRYAVRHLEAMGHECTLQDIAKDRDPPDLSGLDLLGVSCPTMYFRATFAMERAVARLPVGGPRRPAFLLATCMGEPGAHFALLAEQLAFKDWVVLGAHWVLARSNYPSHRAFVAGRLQRAEELGSVLCKVSRPLRPLWGSIWPDCFETDEGDRKRLDRYLEEVVSKAEAGRLDDAPKPNALHKAMPTCNTSGRIIPREFPDFGVSIHIDPVKCTRCGTCELVCPVGIIRQETESSLPIVSRGCTGCWACFNHCNDGAIAGVGAPAGEGRYNGPSRAMRDLFR